MATPNMDWKSLRVQAIELARTTPYSMASIEHAQRRLRATGMSVDKILEAIPIVIEVTVKADTPLFPMVNAFARLIVKMREKPTA